LISQAPTRIEHSSKGYTVKEEGSVCGLPRLKLEYLVMIKKVRRDFTPLLTVLALALGAVCLIFLLVKMGPPHPHVSQEVHPIRALDRPVIQVSPTSCYRIHVCKLA